MRGGTLFWTGGVTTSKFECAVKLIKFRRQLIVMRIIKIDYCKLYVITQSAVDTPDNVL